MNKTNKECRIGIIGAGPAGLSAAEALREQGYRNVTIFEKRHRVGGQALSLSHETEDGRKIIYELGSVQPISSPVLFHLIRRYGLHRGKNCLGKNANPNKAMYSKIYSIIENKPMIDFTKYTFGIPLNFKNIKPFLCDIILLARLLFKYRKLAKPGLNLSPTQTKELSVQYDQWIDQQHFSVLTDSLKMLGVFATGGNPELKQDVLAIQMLKVLIQMTKWPPTRLTYINGVFKPMREGFQELWNRVAKQHHVLLDTDITTIIRKPTAIEVTTTENKFLFDKIIITCPLKETLSILDCSSEEKMLFEKTLYNTGWRVAFLAKNLPHDAVYIFYEPYMLNGYGICPGFIPEGEVGNGVWLYSSVISIKEKCNLSQYYMEIEKFLYEKFNADVVQWLQTVYWSEDFPHYTAEDTKAGIHQKLENLQGKNHTYYLGGAFSGQTHSSVAEYSYAKIKEWF